MILKYISHDEFRKRPSANFGLRRDAIAPNTPAAAAANASIPWTFSDASVDRSFDRVLAWDLVSFRKNPVCLWAHDSSQPPIGRIEGIAFACGKLVGAVRFADVNGSAFADQLRRMVLAGFVKSASVGFRPRRWRVVDSAQRPGGIDFDLVELLEISIVNIPANANALASTSANSAGPRSTINSRLARARQLHREVRQLLGELTPPERIASAERLVRLLPTYRRLPLA